MVHCVPFGFGSSPPANRTPLAANRAGVGLVSVIVSKTSLCLGVQREIGRKPRGFYQWS